MRTIKFRGKRTDTLGWVYGYYAKMLNTFQIKPKELNIIITEKGDYDVLPESVGQFVNRTDKWGKEVYVGDTVEGYYIDQIHGCSVSKVLIKIEQYEDVVKLDELDSFAVLMEVE